MSAHPIGANQHHRADRIFSRTAGFFGAGAGRRGLFGGRGADPFDRRLGRIEAEVQLVELGDGPVRPCPARPLLAFDHSGDIVHAETSHSFNVLPSSDGLGETVIPAASMAATLLAASPLPPEMIAPA